MIPATTPSQLEIEHVAADDLPERWRSPASVTSLQRIGAEWIRRGSSAVFAVPGAVVPEETNFLLNPLHPSFAEISIGEPQAFATDLRLPFP